MGERDPSAGDQGCTSTNAAGRLSDDEPEYSRSMTHAGAFVVTADDRWNVAMPSRSLTAASTSVVASADPFRRMASTFRGSDSNE